MSSPENLLAHFPTETLQEIKEQFEEAQEYHRHMDEEYQRKLAILAIEMERRA